MMAINPFDDPNNWVYDIRTGTYRLKWDQNISRSFPPVPPTPLSTLSGYFPPVPPTPLSRLGSSVPYPTRPTPTQATYGGQPPYMHGNPTYNPYTGGLPPARYRTPQYGYGGTSTTSGSPSYNNWWEAMDAAGASAGWYNPDTNARLYGGPGNFTFGSGAASGQAAYYSPTYGIGTMAVNTGGGRRNLPGRYSGQADQASVDAALEKTGGKKKTTVNYSGEWKKPKYNEFIGDPFKGPSGQKRKKPGKGGKTQKAEGGGTGGQAQFNT